MKYSLLICSLLFIVSCGNGDNSETESSVQEKVVPVYVQELSPKTFNHYVTVQGNVESDKTILISPKITGTVNQVLVKTGQTVKKNETLAILDGEITKSQIKEVENQLELATTLFERQKNLRDQDIGSEVEFLQARTQKESLRNQLTTLNEQYNNYTIRANIAGTVDRVMLKQGENVTADVPVFQVANSEALKVTAEVSEAYITKINRGDSVTVSFPNLDISTKKRLDVVSKVINASNRTFTVEVYIPNIEGMIRPNMITKLTINDFTESDQIIVPVNTVQKANETSFVFLVKQTDSGLQATRTEVKTGSSYGNEIVIKEGLKTGDQLITTGYNNVADEELVEIKNN